MNYSIDNVAKALQQSECPMSIRVFTEHLMHGAEIRAALGVKSSKQVVKACGCNPSMTASEIEKCRNEKYSIGACWYKMWVYG